MGAVGRAPELSGTSLRLLVVVEFNLTTFPAGEEKERDQYRSQHSQPRLPDAVESASGQQHPASCSARVRLGCSGSSVTAQDLGKRSTWVQVRAIPMQEAPSQRGSQCEAVLDSSCPPFPLLSHCEPPQSPSQRRCCLGDPNPLDICSQQLPHSYSQHT